MVKEITIAFFLLFLSQTAYYFATAWMLGHLRDAVIKEIKNSLEKK